MFQLLTPHLVLRDMVASFLYDYCRQELYGVRTLSSGSLPSLIIISGAPGTGKTTLGLRLSSDLDLPFVSRDTIKELLFDSVGWGTRSWSRRLSGASYELVYYVLEHLLRVGTSCIVESNFTEAYATPRLQRLQQRYPFRPLQLVCATSKETRVVRKLWRVQDGKRHPGHAEYHLLRSPRAWVRVVGYSAVRLGQSLRRSQAREASQRWQLTLGGLVQVVDTTVLPPSSYHAVLELVRAHVATVTPGQ